MNSKYNYNYKYDHRSIYTFYTLFIIISLLATISTVPTISTISIPPAVSTPSAAYVAEMPEVSELEDFSRESTNSLNEVISEAHGDLVNDAVVIWDHALGMTIRFVYDVNAESRRNVIAYNRNNILAIDRWDGSIAWQIEAVDITKVQIIRDLVILTDDNRSLYAIDISSGSIVWDLQFNRTIRHYTERDGFIVVTTTEQVDTFEFRTGKHLWTRTHQEVYPAPIIIYWFDYVIFGYNTTVEAYYIENGTLVWSNHSSFGNIVDIRVAGLCCVVHAVIITDSGYIYDLDPYDGSLRWEYTFPEPVILASWDGYVILFFYGLNSNTIYQIGDRLGDYMWERHFTEKVRFYDLSASYDHLLVELETNELIALNYVTGEEEWKYASEYDPYPSETDYEEHIFIVDGKISMARDIHTGTDLFTVTWHDQLNSITCVGNIIYVSVGTNVIAIDIVPTRVILESPRSGGIINSTTPTMRGLVNNDALAWVVEVSSDNSTWVAAEVHWNATSDITYNDTWEAELELEEGDNLITIRTATCIEEEFGIYHTFSTSIFVDSISPILQVTSPTNGSTLNHTNLTLRGSVSDDNYPISVFLSTDNLEWSPMNLLNESNPNTTETNEILWWGNISLVIGIQNLYVKAVDIAGNTDLVILTLFVQPENESQLDLEAPRLTVLFPSNGTIINTPTISVYGLANDNIGIWKVELRIDDGPRVIANGKEEWNLKLEVTEGTHILSVKTIDTSYNFVEKTIRFTVDITPPELEILSPAINLKKSGNISFRGIALDLNGIRSVELSRDGGLNWVLASLASLANGTIEWYLLLTLTPGEHSIYIRATDFADISTLCVFNLTIDLDKPYATIYKPEETLDNKLLLEGRGRDYYGVRCVEASLDNKTWYKMSGNSSWSGTVPIPPEGYQTIFLRITDNAGNVAIEEYPVEEVGAEEKRTEEVARHPLSIVPIAVIIAMIIIFILIIGYLLFKTKNRENNGRENNEE